MVICMKYRKKLLNNDITTFLKNICSEIGERYSFEFDAIGCDGDHVHLFVGAEPKHSPSRVMQIIKSITARNIFKEFPEIRKQLQLVHAKLSTWCSYFCRSILSQRATIFWF